MLFKVFNCSRRICAFLLLCIVFLVSTAVAEAQNNIIVSIEQEQQSSEQMQDTLVQAVVTASAKPSVTVQGAPLQVMDKGSFEKLGIKELHEAVKRFSGVQIKDYGGIGGVKTVSVRSLGTQHTAISYDGVTVSNAQSGQIDIGRFNLDNVEMVTLSIGQTDDIFQSARMYASAGLLNIRTTKPQFEEGRKSHIGAAMKLASFGTYNPALHYRQKLGDRWTLSMNGDWLTSNGEYPFILTNGNIQTTEKRYNSDVNIIRYEANLYGEFKHGGEIAFKGNWMSSQRGLPGSVIYYNSDARERLWDEAGFIQGYYRTHLGNKWQLQGQLKYNYAWNKYTEENESYSNGIRKDYFTQKEIYGAVSVKYEPTGKVDFVLSQDLFRNTLEASYSNFVYPTRYTSLTVMAAKYSSGRLNVTASLLSTYITEELRVGNATPDRFRLSPAASISYKLFPNRNIRVRASYQDIFRTPTFNDLYYDRVGNSALNPEVARQFNVGLTWRAGFSGVLDEVSLQADAYYNKVEDKIVALPTLFVWRMLNMGEVCIKGADVNFGASFTFANGMRGRVHGNYSYQYAVDVTDKSGKNYKHQIPYTPRYAGNLSLSLMGRLCDFGYLMSAVGDRFALPQNTWGNLMDGYIEHSVSLGRQFDMGWGKLHLQLECQNITDVQYDVIQYYPMPGRSFRFTLKFNY